MKHPEQDLQRAVARYLTLALGPETWWTAIGHGGGGKVRGAILKSMGLKPGVPDLLLLHNAELYGIELKAKSRVSKAQDQCQADMMLAGCADIGICKSINDVVWCLNQWRIPIRATVKV
jgi:hypothetical protein